MRYVLYSPVLTQIVPRGQLYRLAEAGLEPARPLRTRDFKSRASAIPPLGLVFKII